MFQTSEVLETSEVFLIRFWDETSEVFSRNKIGIKVFPSEVKCFQFGAWKEEVIEKIDSKIIYHFKGLTTI